MEKQCRILHISPTYYSDSSIIGGGEKYIIYMCKAIEIAANSHGKNVHSSVLSFGEKPGVYTLGDMLKCEVINGLPWDPYSVKISGLQDRIASADVIFVHQCLSAFGLFVASHCKLAKKFVIGTDLGGGEHPLVTHTPEIGRIYDVFHAISQFAASSYMGIEGRIETVAGPVDTSYYIPDTTKLRDRGVVVAVGRLLPHKGFDRIIRSLPQDLHLVIVGRCYDETYREYLNKLAENKSVEFREDSSDEEVLELLKTAGLFVHASTHVDYLGKYYQKPELLGLAPLEALSCGMPALVSSAGSLPELAVINGCLVFADDKELQMLLKQYASSALTFPTADEIHRDVDEKYGLLTFGSKLLRIIYRGLDSP